MYVAPIELKPDLANCIIEDRPAVPSHCARKGEGRDKWRGSKVVLLTVGDCTFKL